MRNFINGIMLVAAGALIAGSSYAEDAAVKGDNVAPMKKIFPNSYGSLKLRHANSYNMQGDDVTGQSTYLMVRPTVGSSWFSGNLNTSVSLNFYKDPNISETTTGTSWLWVDYNGYSNDTVSVTPFIWHFFPRKASGSTKASDPNTRIGIDNYAKLPVETGVGTVTLGTGFETFTRNYSNGTDTGVKNAEEVDAKAYSLTSNGAEGEDEKINQTDKSDPMLNTEYRAKVGFKPNALSKLGMSVTAYVNRAFEPTYMANEETKNIEFDGYSASNTSTMLYYMSYAINDHVTLSNELWQSFGGVFENRRSEERWLNRLNLTATLF